MVLFLCLMCRCGLHAHIGTLMRLLAVEPHSIAGLLFPCQYLCGTILVTSCSMVWDWRVSRAGPMTFYWPSCSLTFCLLLFSLSLISFYGLVFWGWGLRTDRVLIALSQPCIANLFNNNNNNNNNNNKNVALRLTPKHLVLLVLAHTVQVEHHIEGVSDYTWSHNTAANRRCAMLHSNTPPVKIRTSLTTRSSSLRCAFAAEHHTAKQYSKTCRTKPRKHLSRSNISWNTRSQFLKIQVFILSVSLTIYQWHQTPSTHFRQ